MGKKERRFNPVLDHQKKEKQKKIKQKKDVKEKQRVLKKKQERKQVSKAIVELNPDDYEEYKQEEDRMDLSFIPIPPGTPPETDGQIYKALELQPIYNTKFTGERREEIDYSTFEFPDMPWSRKQEETKPVVYTNVQREAVIAKAPELKDFRKESAQMVPAALQRQQLLE